MRNDNLEAWLSRLLNLHHQVIDMGLDRVRKVFAKLDQQIGLARPAPLVISVAGTNGKGSSVAMLVSILKAAGYQVGSYTSPHLLQFNERMQINGQNLSDQQIVEAFKLVEAALADISLTFFEFTTLASLVAFKLAKLDVVVLEVGLGGRLDAVNVVDADAALITAIDVDHADWLGNDRNQIGFEKAGIMRAYKLAVCSDPNPPAKLIEYAAEISADLRLLNQDFSYQAGADDWHFSAAKASFNHLPQPDLVGAFQLQNAAGVLALLTGLDTELNISKQAIAAGLQKIHHPGRLDQRQFGEQTWLFDVAHNPQAAKVLANHLEEENSNQPKIAIFAALNDKDFAPMVAMLKPFIAKWVLVDLQVDRASSLEQLQQTLTDNQLQPDLVVAAKNMSDAVGLVKQSDFSQVLVFGSFYTVSQALEQLDG